MGSQTEMNNEEVEKVLAVAMEISRIMSEWAEMFQQELLKALPVIEELNRLLEEQRAGQDCG